MYTAIVQARMGSTRLPGKIMMSVRDKPLLYYNIRQVLQSKKIDKLIIATTNLSRDDEIVKFVDLYGIEVFRGSEDDVLDRYFHCAKEFKLDAIVRITSDCPLVDPEIIDRCIEKFENENLDYLSNTNKQIDDDWIYDPCGFPPGFGVEVFTFNTLENAWKNTEKPFDREHVTQYILDNPKKFKIGGLENQEDFSDLRLTLDYQVDFDLIKLVIENFPDDEIYNLKKIISFFDDNSHLKLINSHIQFDTGYLKSLEEDKFTEKNHSD